MIFNNLLMISLTFYQKWRGENVGQSKKEENKLFAILAFFFVVASIPNLSTSKI